MAVSKINPEMLKKVGSVGGEGAAKSYSYAYGDDPVKTYERTSEKTEENDSEKIKKFPKENAEENAEEEVKEVSEEISEEVSEEVIENTVENTVENTDAKDVKPMDEVSQLKENVEELITNNPAVAKQVRSLRTDTVINIKLDILKEFTNSKFAYKTLDKLMDEYVETLSEEDKKRFYVILKAKLETEITLKM